MAKTNALDDLLSDLEGLDGAAAPTGGTGEVIRFVPRPPATEKNTSFVNPKAKFVTMRAAQSGSASERRDHSPSPQSSELDSILRLIGPTSPDRPAGGDVSAPVVGSLHASNSSPITCAVSSATSSTAAAFASPPPKPSAPSSAAKQSLLSPESQSVDDFLNDLDSALMPSPKGNATGSGGGPAPPASAAQAQAPACSPPILQSRNGGASMQQRMFPSMGSPPAGSASTASSNTGSNSVSAVRSSSFDAPASGQLPSSIGTSSGAAARHTVAVVGSGSTSSSAAPTSGFSMQSIPPTNGGGGKITKCSRVTLAGSSAARGLKSSAFSKCTCDNLRCIQCNFKVMSFTRCKWASDVDYMFFRNANTNPQKLDIKLNRSSNPGDEFHEYCAYCCQCSWTDVKDEKTLAPASGVGSDQLHWVCAGHQS